jgi:hypothetical protein
MPHGKCKLTEDFCKQFEKVDVLLKGSRNWTSLAILMVRILSGLGLIDQF